MAAGAHIQKRKKKLTEKTIKDIEAHTNVSQALSADNHWSNTGMVGHIVCAFGMAKLSITTLGGIFIMTAKRQIKFHAPSCASP